MTILDDAAQELQQEWRRRSRRRAQPGYLDGAEPSPFCRSWLDRGRDRCRELAEQASKGGEATARIYDRSHYQEIGGRGFDRLVAKLGSRQAAITQLKGTGKFR